MASLATKPPMLWAMKNIGRDWRYVPLVSKTHIRGQMSLAKGSPDVKIGCASSSTP